MGNITPPAPDQPPDDDDTLDHGPDHRDPDHQDQQEPDAAELGADFNDAINPELEIALKRLASCELSTVNIALYAVLDATKGNAVQRECARLAAITYLKLRYTIQRSAEQAVAAVFGEPPKRTKAAKEEPTPAPIPSSGIISYADDEPAEAAGDLAELLVDLYDFIGARVHLHHDALVAVTVWIVHTYCCDCVELTPYLIINSPVKRCGKSTLLKALTRLAYHPQPASNATPAVFRIIEQHGPTLLLDEADRWLVGKQANPDMIALINAGNQKGTPALRTVGDKHEPAAFDVYSPKALAGIGSLPDTIADRGIAIPMRRKPAAVRIQRITRRDDGVAHQLRRRIVRWVGDHHDAVADVDLDCMWLPEALNDRARNCWEPLMAIASFAGPSWVEIVITAATGLAADDADVDGPGVILLRDIQRVFDLKPGVEKIASLSLCAELAALDDDTAPWKRWHPRAQGDADRRIQPIDLAGLLKPFGVDHRKVRIGSQTLWGYRFKDFVEAFGAYITPTATPKDDADDDE